MHIQKVTLPAQSLSGKWSGSGSTHVQVQVLRSSFPPLLQALPLQSGSGNTYRV